MRLAVAGLAMPNNSLTPPAVYALVPGLASFAAAGSFGR
jgi:hypothetical protein